MRRALAVAALLAAGCTRDEAKLEALLQSAADALGRGDLAAACRTIWFADANPARCDEVLGALAAQAPRFAGARVAVERVSPYGHGAGAQVLARAGGDRFRAHLLCSTDTRAHVAGPGCRWWIADVGAPER